MGKLLLVLLLDEDSGAASGGWIGVAAAAVTAVLGTRIVTAMHRHKSREVFRPQRQVALEAMHKARSMMMLVRPECRGPFKQVNPLSAAAPQAVSRDDAAAEGIMLGC